MKRARVPFLSLVAVVGATLCQQGVAYAQTKTVVAHKTNARICDPSGCYVAWRVVDSDHDGVSDADELMAGTNPYDPRSRPRLEVVAELAGKEQLPSFQAGRGAFVVFPVEIQAMIQKTKSDPLGELDTAAFPLTEKRADSLTRLGISQDLLSEHGIDVKRDGLTVGPLARPSQDGGFEPRVGGVEARLISDDDHCCKPLIAPDPERDLVYVDDNVMVFKYSDGGFLFEYADDSGDYISPDGKMFNWYVNPDADPSADVPTPEQEKAFFRLRGATILTVENWSAPDVDWKPSDRNASIILVDAEHAFDTAVLFATPRVTGAQPEVDPNLPNPTGAANPQDFKDKCFVGCP